MPTAPRPSVRLVRPSRTAATAWLPDAEQQRVIAHTDGPLRVVGGPGTGATSVLARAAAARLNAGALADEVLLLTFSRRGAAGLRDAVVAETTVALREVPVRSFESYAWAVLDRARRRHSEWSAPRLITGPEQDAIIRDLLAGALSGVGATRWPDDLRAALPTRGFAQELRDALMRCAQRGISAADIREWAARFDRPVWDSLASFLSEYSGVTAMRLDDSYDPAELVRAVVDLWKREPAELRREHQRLRHLYVDEAAELDPAKLEMIELLAGGLRSVVISGDPHQAVFGFRGADRRGLMEFAPESVCTLRTGYRATPGVAGVVGAWGEVIGAPRPERSARDADDDLTPLVALQSSSPAREAADVAAVLRERHLLDRVPWSEMCVVVRSVAAAMPVIRRAFSAAGVPLDAGIDEQAVGRAAAVRSLLELVRLSRASRADAADVEEVLRSPYFRLDALRIRRLRKALRAAELREGGGRSSSALLAAAIAGGLAIPGGDATAGLRELVRIVRLLRSLEEGGATGEELLHAAWRETGAEARWRSEALLGGARGADADQRLDAVIAAFDIASALSSRLREASFETIAMEIERQELPADRLSRGERIGETVRVLSANNAKGRQWQIVAVMGVQDGAWPNLVPRNTILRTEDLADLASGLDVPTIDRRAALLQEERRLFYVALARASRQVVLSAVDGGGERPSRFFVELCERVGVEPGVHRAERAVRRQLSLLDHVATLRTCLLDAAAPETDRAAAARALRTLAEAGVEGAAPEDWYALRQPSSDDPIVADGTPVAVSPSAATAFGDCPLRWFLGRVGESRGTANAAVGTLVHQAFEAIGDVAGRSHAELYRTMRAVVDAGWGDLEIESPWDDRRWRRTVDGLIDRLAGWLVQNPREWVANEQPFDVAVGNAIIRGTVDRLERDPDTGGLFTVDLKTGSTISDVARNPQLGLYQLAVEAGGFGAPERSAGAALLFVKNKKKASESRQPALSADDEPQWAAELTTRLAEGMSASSFAAQPGAVCRTCEFEALCPAVRVIGEED
ncbi:ATP-dependent helicase [Cumulibacter manganitolerans]|uniref:ATP-dependent helicase n=1 Tax=Cumulibacter manganitolerans TaxID=1884992 RepID=UPI001296C432|nr:ATP-dependent DNA helicase [Cumulibacter manganitolerans]